MPSSGEIVKTSETSQVFHAGVFTDLAHGAVATIRKPDKGEYSMVNYRYQSIYDPAFDVSTKVAYLRVHMSPEDDGWAYSQGAKIVDPVDTLNNFVTWYLDPSHNFPMADHHIWFTGYLHVVVKFIDIALRRCIDNGTRHSDEDGVDSSSTGDPFQPRIGDQARGDVIPSENQQELEPLWLPSCSVLAMRAYIKRCKKCRTSNDVLLSPQLYFYLKKLNEVLIYCLACSVSCALGELEKIQDKQALGPSDQCIRKVGVGSYYCRTDKEVARRTYARLFIARWLKMRTCRSR
ncbi:hypothetical protein RRG08_042423 [Elysia crispata]|uniref:Uncharacterized protein n=1 Tax=Elysia crispata TaxID=231223 RepID=A0AAE0ZC25_9GAST|nr:hypothetical protein RRG08_042423 [Elysia crispata]